MSRADANDNWRSRTEKPQPPSQSASSTGQTARWHVHPAKSEPASNLQTQRGQAQEAVDYDKRIYCGNLLYFAKAKDVEQLLADLSIDYRAVVMSVDPYTARNPSYCFIGFDTAEAAQAAMVSLEGKLLFDRPVKCRPATRPRNHHNTNGQASGSQSIRSQQRGTGPVIDDRNEIASQSSRPKQQTGFVFDRWRRDDAESFHRPIHGTRVLIGNLPSFNLDPYTVQSRMREFTEGHNITAVSKIIPPEPGNESHGHFVFVDFATPAEAEQAVEALNGTSPPWDSNVRLRVTVASDKGSWKVNERQKFLDANS